MARRSKQGDLKKYLKQLIDTLENFEKYLDKDDLREKVIHLAPAAFILRDLGCSLMQSTNTKDARNRILAYLKKYVGTIVNGDELMIISGISEYARRIRELRTDDGWKILTGVTISEMEKEELDVLFKGNIPNLKPDDYLLVSLERDVEAANRKNIAKKIRNNKKLGARKKILEYMQNFIGKEISGEELRYVSKTSEWGRRTRELRTEEGWPVTTYFTGRPDLPVGFYVLEENKQGPKNERNISPSVYRAVLERDSFTCRVCGWNKELASPGDHRYFEVHHIKSIAEGGSNTMENLETLCNRCHHGGH